ncbi:hypothetical protein I6A60_32235 [Frankia sp. AgB1.9]|uniref:tetratricopeptide repeat protein n=1 Tax=unclassified Frankia TaxID=2632575 RepID=UPI001932B2C1|nr:MULTISPECIES: hypothetical protein [unclassified Frankia]MBL7491521.1 hypothetical protein [Frankia sp. AgW1.1]MBL7552494.1 hypothetical protein [Frankia sp. AgB1.9]MBL7622109.1 hypothetical protein [Frankia sp. AgB1.8]
MIRLRGWVRAQPQPSQQSRSCAWCIHFTGRTGGCRREAFHLISPHDLPRMAGACHLALGRPQRAESLLASIGAGSPAESKADAVILGNLALAHIRQHQIDQACAVLAQTINLVARTWSGGSLTLIFQARRELQQWPDQPAVRDVGDRILDLIDPAGRPL